ncbi:MAG TPA: ABC transporter permease [Vicinamibacterales bacterium]|nr:ABC transporter permease [Vicinamibacterales bacterium]
MRTLPRFVTWLVRRVVPAHRADTLLTDLEDDYAAAAHRGSANWWLLGETASLVTSYSRARIIRARDTLPLLVRDVQLVTRSLRRGRLATAAAASLLAVGLAAVLLTTGLADALLFRPVSATHPDTLRRIVATDRAGRLVTRFSFIELQAIQTHLQDAGDMAAVYLQPVVLRASNIDVQTMAEVVDGPYFNLTGTTTVIGRGLMWQDNRPEAAPVTVIGEPFWRRHFDASAAVLGMPIRLNGAIYTIVGVAASVGSSTFLGASVDAWVALAHADPLLNAGWRTNMRDRWFTPFALPRTGHAEITARLAIASDDLARTHPDPWRERTLDAIAATAMVGTQRTAAGTLAGVLVGLSVLILLAAASNVAGVLLARAGLTARAAAIHMSIGSGRIAVARRQMLEGAFIGIMAGAVAAGLYAWGRVQLAEVAVLPTLAFRLDLPLEGRTVALTIAAGAVAGLLLAIAPALWVTRLDVINALRDGGERGGASARLSLARKLLVSAQVCVSLVLIVSATLFFRSLDALMHADVGFARAQLVAMDFDVEPAGLTSDGTIALGGQVLTRVGALPGIVAVAMSNRAPIDSSTPTLDVALALAGRDAAPLTGVTMYLATEAYFETVGVPLVAGRPFTASEVARAAGVVIVNQALAARLWPEGDAVSRALYLPREQKTVTVVGVARDSKYRALTEIARPHLYRPTPPTLGLTLLARTAADEREALRLIQRELDAIGAGLVGFFPRTLEDHLAVQLLPTRAAARVATALGALALLLSATALYALVSWFVVLRAREISIRMALGATPRQVRNLVIRQAVVAALPGLAAGTALALAIAGIIRSALFGVSPYDPVALGGGVGVLVTIVLVAGYLPSRQATRADPGAALRQ